MNTYEILQADRDILLGYAQTIADQRRGGVMDDLATCQKKMMAELSELMEAHENSDASILDILAECADVLYYAVKIDAILGDHTTSDRMQPVVERYVYDYNMGIATIVIAAKAKYALRAKDLKDHEAENIAIEVAIEMFDEREAE